MIGKVKETVMQVSMSKKWASKPVLDESPANPLKTAKGKPVLKKSYSVLQDDFFHICVGAGYADVERGERGNSEEHLTVTQFKDGKRAGASGGAANRKIGGSGGDRPASDR